MLLTKYEHACFTLEKDGKLLIVDPGEWTTDLGAPENVVAIVVTHEHPDHFDPAALGALIAHNPDAVIYAHENITRQFGDTLPHRAVDAGQKITVAPFTVEFFGGQHATIHESYPAIDNLGILINDTVYYPGDSFTNPNRQVEVLALPVGAPWLKISESMNFAANIKAKLVFPTHDAVLSSKGKSLADRMIPNFVESNGGTYKRLLKPIEING